MTGRDAKQEQVNTVGKTLILATASSITFCVFPVMLGVVSRHRDLGWRESGWTATGLQLGMLTGTLAALVLVRRQRYRGGLLFGAASAALASLLVASTSSVTALVCLEFATGAAAGCVFGIAGALLARFPLPERNFAIMLGLQALCGSAYAALLSLLEGRFGNAIAECSISAWFLVVLICAYGWRSESYRAERPENLSRLARGGYRSVNRHSACAVLGLMAFEMAVLTIWLYSDRVGLRSGLTADRVDVGIALGNLGAVPAGLFGAVLRDRFGHRLIAIVSTVLVLMAEGFVLWPQSFTGYAISQIGLNFAWTLGLAYYTALAVKADRSGRTLQVVPLAVVVASASAPLCVAAFARDGEPNSLAAISIALGVMAVIVTVFGGRSRSPELAPS